MTEQKSTKLILLDWAPEDDNGHKFSIITTKSCDLLWSGKMRKEDDHNADLPNISDLYEVYQNMEERRQKLSQKVRHIENRLIQCPTLIQVSYPADRSRTMFSGIVARFRQTSERAIFEQEIRSRIEMVQSMHKQLIRSLNQMYSMNHKVGLIVKQRILRAGG
jgi:hypothetical protein